MDDKVFTFKSMFVGLSLIEATVYLFVILRKSRMKHTYMDYIQHLKNTQTTILAELERLLAENERLRK